MNCDRSDKWITLGFEEQERELLLFSLEEIREHYSQEESVLPENFRSYWRGKLSKSSGNEAELRELSEDLREARLEWRDQRLNLVNKWLANAGTLKINGRGILVLDYEEAEHFLCVLNDRRLLLAIEFNVDENLMSQFPRDLDSPDLQQALCEIHFLAMVQQYLVESLD